MSNIILPQCVCTTGGKNEDMIFLKNMSFSATVGQDAWGELKPQPLLISLLMRCNFQDAAEADDIEQTTNYSKVYKSVQAALTRKASNPSSLGWLLWRITEELVPLQVPDSSFRLTAVLPKGILCAEGGIGQTVDSSFDAERDGRPVGTVFVNDIKVNCIIGLNPGEREEKQQVVISLNVQLEEEYETRDAIGIFKAVIKVCTAKASLESPS